MSGCDGCLPIVDLKQGPKGDTGDTGAAGADGSDGADGDNGVALIAIDHNQSASNNPTTQTSYAAVMDSVTIGSAYRLNAVGDSLRIKAKYLANLAGTVDNAYSNIKLKQGSTSTDIDLLPSGSLILETPAQMIDFIITRVSSTEVSFQRYMKNCGNTAYDYSSERLMDFGGLFYQEFINQGGAIDFTSDFDIEFHGKVDVGTDALKLGFYSIEFLNKA